MSVYSLERIELVGKERWILILLHNILFGYLEHNTVNFYSFSARNVRFKLKDRITEILITNRYQTFLPPAVMEAFMTSAEG